tara:strand:- start:50 stop:631 length:582 start_codon:yes stop_codon:yes gene_type:complete
MSKTIEEQKEIAEDVLTQLEIICPHAILAGGAPRDWYMGTPANDLDIYFSLDPDSKAASNRSQLKKVLPEGMVLQKEHASNRNPMYKHMKALRRIYYYTYRGMDVQLIQLDQLRDVFGAVDNMSCSICKAWWKKKGVVTTYDFRLTLKSEHMFLNDAYKWGDYHPQKMEERFKKAGYRLSTKKRAEDAVLSLI